MFPPFFVGKEQIILIRHRLYSMIEKISYRSRRNKCLKQTQENIDKYMKISDVEFIMEYTEVCSRYERKKLMFTAFSVGLIISLIMIAWKYNYDSLFIILSSEINIIGDVKKHVIILSIFSVLPLFIILIILCDISRNIFLLNKKKIFLNQLKEIRENAKNK